MLHYNINSSANFSATIYIIYQIKIIINISDKKMKLNIYSICKAVLALIWVGICAIIALGVIIGWAEGDISKGLWEILG